MDSVHSQNAGYRRGSIVHALKVMLLMLVMLLSWFIIVLHPCRSEHCIDDGEHGTEIHGGEHNVCIYHDRVVKRRKTCSPRYLPHKVLYDHIKFLSTKQSDEMMHLFSDILILLTPYQRKDGCTYYRPAFGPSAVPWVELKIGLAALDDKAQEEGVVFADLTLGKNFHVASLVNGVKKGIIIDAGIHPDWVRRTFSPVLNFFGCHGAAHRKSFKPTALRPLCRLFFFYEDELLHPYKNLYGDSKAARLVLHYTRHHERDKVKLTRNASEYQHPHQSPKPNT